MDKFINIGTKLYHRYLSDIDVLEIDKNSIKADTKTHGLLEFPIYDIGKTIYIEKSHSNYRFETYESYFKFLEEEKMKEDSEKELLLKNEPETCVVPLSKEQEVQTGGEYVGIKYNKILNEFTIYKNNYLKHDINGYFHQYYTGFQNPGNPDFLNVLKNTFNSTPYQMLIDARNKVIEIITRDIANIMRVSNERNYLCMCVPRAKVLNEYSRLQLMFIEAVSLAAQKTKGLIDGTEYIVRHKNTRTTHLRNVPIEQNDGSMPYPGITQDTCSINGNKITGKNIILIDDIYTRNVNIDEDCIQALFDNGAKNIIFYAIGYTRRL